MKRRADQQQSNDFSRTPRRGLIILYTGDGKGKTTAALGLVMRAWGHDMRCCVIQFIKHEEGRWGERIAAERMGIEWHTLGEGFTWRSEDLAKDRRKAHQGWDLAKQKIASSDYDLVVLDEFTYPLTFGWLDPARVVAWLRENRPPETHLVITGRGRVAPLVELADLVSEVRDVKHPFERGVRAQKGIEY